MPTLRQSITVAAAPAQLFDLCENYDARIAWDPWHGAYRFFRGEDGAELLWYRTREGVETVVRFVARQYPSRIAMTMVSGPWWLASLSGSWSFEAADARCTKLTYRYHFRLCGRWPALLLGPLAAWWLGRDINRRMIALRDYVEAQRQE